MDIIKPKGPERSPPLIEAPSGYGYCATCFFWRGAEKDACVTPQGVMFDRAVMLQQGIVAPPGSVIARVKTCTRYPEWVLKTEQHWCGDYVQNHAPITFSGGKTKREGLT